jgi:septum formation protein
MGLPISGAASILTMIEYSFSFYEMENRLILASRSPRRYELLTRLGLEVEVIPGETDERPAPGESPRDLVIRLAGAKAAEITVQHPDRWVVAADTVVCAGESLLGKPGNREEAFEMLRLLSGREHEVYTGFSVSHLKKKKTDQDAVRTAVKMKRVTEEEIDWYIGTGEPFDKAGAYAIQGAGAFLIQSIRGSYTNVVGLPMCELVGMMSRLGALKIADFRFQISD